MAVQSCGGISQGAGVPSPPPSVCLPMQRLSDLYYDIHRSYLKVAEVVNSEKRLFGRYYRVAFYGQVSELGLFCLQAEISDLFVIQFREAEAPSSESQAKSCLMALTPSRILSGGSAQLSLCKPLLWI